MCSFEELITYPHNQVNTRPVVPSLPPLLEIVTVIKCQQASLYVTLTAAGGGINSPVCLSCKFNEFISKFHQRNPVEYRIQITFN